LHLRKKLKGNLYEEIEAKKKELNVVKKVQEAIEMAKRIVDIVVGEAF